MSKWNDSRNSFIDFARRFYPSPFSPLDFPKSYRPAKINECFQIVTNSTTKRILFFSLCSVAVVENQTPFVFNALVAPIRLGSAFVGANENAVVAGWGGAGPEGPPWPNNLQALNVTTLTNPDCRSRHTEQNAEFVVDQKICTYYPYAGVCFGKFVSTFFSRERKSINKLMF